jgi:hypothetical protein
VEAVVAETLLGNAGVVGRIDRAAERGRIPEPGVVDEDEQDVRRTLGWLGMRCLIPVGLRPFQRSTEDAGERGRRIGRRDLST